MHVDKVRTQHTFPWSPGRGVKRTTPLRLLSAASSLTSIRAAAMPQTPMPQPNALAFAATMRRVHCALDASCRAAF